MTPFKHGDKVTHQTLGDGVVIRIRTTDDDEGILVHFDQGGFKELMWSTSQDKLSKTGA